LKPASRMFRVARRVGWLRVFRIYAGKNRSGEPPLTRLYCHAIFISVFLKAFETNDLIGSGLPSHSGLIFEKSTAVLLTERHLSRII